MPRDSVVPARYFQTFLAYFETQGVDIEAVCEATGLKPETFAKSGRIITSDELERLLAHLYSRKDFAPDFFLRAGQVFQVGSHEILGYAMLSSPTIDHAWRIHARYFNLITPAFCFEYKLDADHAVIEHTPVLPLSSLALKAFFESIASITNANVHELTGGKAPDYDIYFSIDQPEYEASFSVMKGARCHFLASESPRLKMVFPAQLARRKLPMANTSALCMAEAQCKKLVSSNVADRKMAEWVAMMLLEAHDSLPTMDDLAKTLNVSRKTLNRHLKREGTSFRALSSRVKRERAINMLGEGKSVTEIALTLGYCNPANFTRAFKRLHGLSPSAYRKLSGPPV